MSTSDVLLLSEAAALLKISESSLYKLARGKKIKASKRLGRWRFRRTELLQWLEASDDQSRLAAVPARAPRASAPTAAGNTAYPWDKTPPATPS